MKVISLILILCFTQVSLAEVSVNQLNRLKLSVSQAMNQTQVRAEQDALEDLFYLLEYHENLVRQPNFYKKCDQFSGDVATACKQYRDSQINPRVLELWSTLSLSSQTSNKSSAEASVTNIDAKALNEELIKIYLSGDIFTAE